MTPGEGYIAVVMGALVFAAPPPTLLNAGGGVDHTGSLPIEAFRLTGKRTATEDP